MKITYNVDEADVKYFLNFASARYKSGMGTLYTILWWLVLFDIVMMLFALEKEPYKGSVFFVLFYILTILISSMVIISYISKHKKPNFKLVTKSYGGKMDLEISKEGITESNPYKKTFYSWACTENIHNNSDYILIELGGDMMYTIRKSSIEGEDPQAFYNVAKHFLDEHNKLNSKDNLNQ